MSEYDNKQIGERIKKARELKGFNKKELASLIQVAPSTIQRYEEGTISKIKIPIIESIANITNVNPMWLLCKSDKMKKITNTNDSLLEKIPVAPIERGYKIPVLGYVAAGIPIFVEENIVEHVEISSDLIGTGEYFGLKIKGDSMSPRMIEGDTVIVRRQDDAESGEIVVVMVNGDEATCKRLMKYKDGIALLSFNSLYKPMEYTNDEIKNSPVRIIGKVIQFIGKF